MDNDDKYLDMLGNEIDHSDILAYPSIKTRNYSSRRPGEWRYAKMNIAIVIDIGVHKGRKRVKILNVSSGRISFLTRLDRTIVVNDAREAKNEVVAKAIAMRERCFLLRSVKGIEFSGDNDDETNKLVTGDPFSRD